MRDQESRPVTLKIFSEEAEDDHQISLFPSTLLPEASPYALKYDFDNKVRQMCTIGKRPSSLGLKVSKAIFVGDVGVGKTCLVNRFCHEAFDHNYKATVGVDFEVERFDVLHTPFNLQIWDTAGQERFKCIASSYYRGANVIVVVFDVSNMGTLANCSQWMEDALGPNLQRLGPSPPILFVVGTKKDTLSVPSYESVEVSAIRVAQKLSAELWMVSSKTGENVRSFFLRLAALAFEKSMIEEIEHRNAGSSKFNVDSPIALLENNEMFNQQRKKCRGNGCSSGNVRR